MKNLINSAENNVFCNNKVYNTVCIFGNYLPVTLNYNMRFSKEALKIAK